MDVRGGHILVPELVVPGSLVGGCLFLSGLFGCGGQMAKGKPLG
jgi:hypothetical protein